MAHAARGRADRRGIAQVAQHKLHICGHAGQIFAVAGRQIIQHPHARAVPHEAVHQIRADETGPPRHQTLVAAHHAHPPPSELANCGRAKGQMRSQKV